MKEIFSAFGSEVFRPLATIVIPGATAISVWFVALLQRYKVFRDLVAPNHTEAILVLILVSIAVGLLVEDVGSRVESRCFDKLIVRKPEFVDHEKEWYEYLRLAFKIEPVGQRYLRTIVLRLKFELGTLVALALATPGLFLTDISARTEVAIIVFIVLFWIYLLIEARASHELLHRIRHELIKGGIVYPCEIAASAANDQCS